MGGGKSGGGDLDSNEMARSLHFRAEVEEGGGENLPASSPQRVKENGRGRGREGEKGKPRSKAIRGRFNLSSPEKGGSDG